MTQPPSSWDPNQGQPAGQGDYGQQPAQQYPQSNPYGQPAQGEQHPQSNPYGQPAAPQGEQYPQSNPYGQPAAQPDPYAQQNQYGQPAQQQPYGYAQPAPGYPAPGYGYSVAIEKPGAVTGAAVLGFIQAGLTLLTTAILFIGLVGSGGAASDAFSWIIAIAQLAGVVLLIFGAVQLMSGTNRTLYAVAAGLEIAISLSWIIYVSVQVSGVGDIPGVGQAVGVVVVIAIFFAAMPLIGLILSLGSSVSRYIAAKSGAPRQ